MRRVLVLVALLSVAPAFAQVASPTPNAADRIATRIGALVIQIENQQDQIVALKERIKELEEKATKETPPPAKPK